MTADRAVSMVSEQLWAAFDGAEYVTTVVFDRTTRLDGVRGHAEMTYCSAPPPPLERLLVFLQGLRLVRLRSLRFLRRWLLRATRRWCRVRGPELIVDAWIGSFVLCDSVPFRALALSVPLLLKQGIPLTLRFRTQRCLHCEVSISMHGFSGVNEYGQLPGYASGRFACSTPSVMEIPRRKKS